MSAKKIAYFRIFGGLYPKNAKFRFVDLLQIYDKSMTRDMTFCH